MQADNMDETMKAFAESIIAAGSNKVLDLTWHKGKLLALLSKSNVITVKMFGSSLEHQVCNMQSKVTFGRFETEGEALLLLAGDESGAAYCFHYDLEQGAADPVAIFVPPPHLRNTGVQFMLRQPTASELSTMPAELVLWIVSASHVLLVSAPMLGSDPLPVELQLQLDLHIPVCDHSHFLNLEVSAPAPRTPIRLHCHLPLPHHPLFPPNAATLCISVSLYAAAVLSVGRLLPASGALPGHPGHRHRRGEWHAWRAGAFSRR
jgi:hypothetical protein